MKRGKARVGMVILLICGAMLFGACAGGQQSGQKLVVTEYLLEQAGFEKWPVNMQTFYTQSLMDAIPREKIVTYKLRGETYHVYSDVAGQTLYVGDELAYQKYLALTGGRTVCERVDATESAPFWRCYMELKQGGPAR